MIGLEKLTKTSHALFLGGGRNSTQCWSLDAIKRVCCLVILYFPGFKCGWRDESNC